MTNIVTSKTRGKQGGRSSNQGKGTWRRTAQVDAATFAANWERTFGGNKKAKESRNGRRRAD